MEQALGGLGTEGPCYLTRTTTDPAEAERWFEQFEGAGLDGVIAKPLATPYTQNGRVMFKVKHARTADVVVAGYREHKGSTPERPLLGSLLLGLYDRPPGEGGELQRWQEFLTANPDRVPGTQSRWSQGKDLSFTPLRPERVVEVGYEHMEGRRFRHTAQFKRWRTDRDPESCGYEQLEEVVSYDLGEVLSGGH
jgi:ATP-dependent DNA ligase